jgi:hypothetical protein
MHELSKATGEICVYRSVAILVLALSTCRAAHMPSGPLSLNAQNGTTIENLVITSSTGPCLTIVNSTNITIHNSEIGPCGSSAIVITGGNNVRIVDNYIHAEVPAVLSGAAGCCDFGDNIYASNTVGLLVQGNMIAWGETNLWAASAVSNVTIRGNFFLNPQNNIYRGQQIGFGGAASNNSNGILVDSNYTLAESTGAGIYKHPARQEDAINFQFGPTGITATNNYIVGGLSPSGCGLIIDGGQGSANFANNKLYNTGQTGICIEGGNGIIVNNNRILGDNLSGHPIFGGGNNNVIIYDNYATGCRNITVTNNVGAYQVAGGAENGYWNPGSCINVTVDNTNQWGYQGSSVRASLTPFATRFPTPMIPPVPYLCAVVSPFTNQSVPRCN